MFYFCVQSSNFIIARKIAGQRVRKAQHVKQRPLLQGEVVRAHTRKLLARQFINGFLLGFGVLVLALSLLSTIDNLIALTGWARLLKDNWASLVQSAAEAIQTRLSLPTSMVDLTNALAAAATVSLTLSTIRWRRVSAIFNNKRAVRQAKRRARQHASGLTGNTSNIRHTGLPVPSRALAPKRLPRWIDFLPTLFVYSIFSFIFLASISSSAPSEWGEISFVPVVFLACIAATGGIHLHRLAKRFAAILLLVAFVVISGWAHNALLEFDRMTDQVSSPVDAPQS